MFEAIQQYKDDDLINGIIDEVTEPQLRQVIIETWREMAEADRNKQINKVTNLLKSFVEQSQILYVGLCLQDVLLTFKLQHSQSGSRSIVHQGVVLQHIIVAAFVYVEDHDSLYSGEIPPPPAEGV